MDLALIQKYNTAGPRYTSYPTVPYWDPASFTTKAWERSVKEAFIVHDRSVSIYIHLPYCESLCTYCGCNTRITKNHAVEENYIRALIKEWKMYLALFDEKPQIKEIHLGGGTPTFFSPQNLKWLIEEITAGSEIPEHIDFAFEANPVNTTYDHLKTLRDIGFNRVSFGIQDFDPKVQKLINRVQTYEQVKEVVDVARSLGYASINFDLIYGLPGQSVYTVKQTIKRSIDLNPDRIAFYSYAHVPAIKPAQLSYESYLPKYELKQRLYEVGKTQLTDQGYYDIGMDHFARETDELYKAYKSSRLYRNFMGYTVQRTKLLVGLGASAISDAWSAFSQNEKNVEKYLEFIANDQMPILKGHILSSKDLIIRRKILDLICNYYTDWSDAEWEILTPSINQEMLATQEADGLVRLSANAITVTETGKAFIRNICMALDAYLQQHKKQAVFSKTI